METVMRTMLATLAVTALSAVSANAAQPQEQAPSAAAEGKPVSTEAATKTRPPT
jgi:opacity protein-like surface antigen